MLKFLFSPFKKLWYRFQFWLTGWKIYGWMMKYIVPYIRFSTYYALPTNRNFIQWGAVERDGYRHLAAGDIILAVDEFKFSSMVIGHATAQFAQKTPLFIPSHAALCIAKNRNSDFEIAEMTHHNYTRSTWEDVTRTSTRVVIIRCKDWDETYIRDVVIPTALSFHNRKYDDRFQMGTATLACSELVYFADAQKRLRVDLQPVIGNKPYITPVGLMLAENIEVIWDSDRVCKPISIGTAAATNLAKNQPTQPLSLVPIFTRLEDSAPLTASARHSTEPNTSTDAVHKVPQASEMTSPVSSANPSSTTNEKTIH